MTDIRELRAAELERKSLENRLEEIKQREAKLHRELRDMKDINNDTALHKNATVAEVNYVLGESDGFIRGYDAAIAMIVESLTNAYRDIPMTEDELYVLVELGDARRMARVRDAKSRQIAEKAGWEKEWHGMIPTWKKVEPKEEQAEATE